MRKKAEARRYVQVKKAYYRTMAISRNYSIASWRKMPDWLENFDNKGKIIF